MTYIYSVQITDKTLSNANKYKKQSSIDTELRKQTNNKDDTDNTQMIQMTMLKIIKNKRC